MNQVIEAQTERRPPLVIYHGGCADGQGSAAAFYTRHPEAEFFPASYGKPVPDVVGREVYMLDFSYPRAVVESMCATAESVTIIDHHKSAMLDLEGLELPNLTQCFVMDRSGAVLTWEWCWPGRKIPQLLEHIQDRDLWAFKLYFTRPLSAWLYSLEFDIAHWAALLDDKALDDAWDKIMAQGEALLRQDQKRVREIASRPRVMNIEGHHVLAVNCNHYFASDVGSELAKAHPIAAMYYDNADGRRVFSLRAVKGGFDVSLLAKRMGGGGHAAAAGFSVSRERAQLYEMPQGLAIGTRLMHAWWTIRNRK